MNVLIPLFTNLVIIKLKGEGMDKLKTALLFPLMIILTALLVYLFFEIKSKSYNSHAQQAIVGDLDYIYSKPSMTLLNTEH